MDIFFVLGLGFTPFRICISLLALIALNENLLLMFDSDPPGCRGRQELGKLTTTNPCAWQITAPVVARMC